VTYDAVAARYDDHFGRPVDRWEDARLARIAGRAADGRNVLDLGCGTGWIADHCHPATYTGVDSSAGMLAECARKHPDATLVKADLGDPGWPAELPSGRVYTAVTCTWAAHYFGDLAALLRTLSRLLTPGTPVVLHGQAPRYESRVHYIQAGVGTGHRTFSRRAVAAAARAAGWPPPRVRRCGALPDRLTGHGGPVAYALWAATLPAPAALHYSVAYTWRVPRV
jgi:trans-aconitate methyltransferase